MGEDEYKKIVGLMKDIEYYEIQNMLNYMLRSENMFKGVFQRVSLEVLYINLYNISKLRYLDNVIDGLTKREHRDAYVSKKQDECVEERHTPEPQFNKDIKGFIEYLKQKKPFISSIFQSLEIKIDGNNMIVFIDRNYKFIKEDSSLKDDIKEYSKMFFGCEMNLILKDVWEKKSDLLDDYVKEAESLFKV